MISVCPVCHSANNGADMKKVAVVYGITGGLHPQMFGIAVRINQMLKQQGFEVAAHIGFSGGAIVASLMSRGLYHCDSCAKGWLREATEYSPFAKIGGWKIFSNAYWLLSKGGLLSSQRLHDKVFRHIIPGELKVPAYAGSWCVSHGKEVLFKLTEENMSKAVLSSAALPFAISPYKWSNRELLEQGYGDLLDKIRFDRNGHSFFADGGISSALGVGIIDDADAVRQAEAECGYAIPVIGVNLDNVVGVHQPEFDSNSWYRKIWETGWGAVRANVLDDLREARKERHVQLCVAPTPPELKKFQMKLDTSYEEASLMYEYGADQAEWWFSQRNADGQTPLEELNVAIEAARSGTVTAPENIGQESSEISGGVETTSPNGGEEADCADCTEDTNMSNTMPAGARDALMSQMASLRSQMDSLSLGNSGAAQKVSTVSPELAAGQSVNFSMDVSANNILIVGLCIDEVSATTYGQARLHTWKDNTYQKIGSYLVGDATADQTFEGELCLFGPLFPPSLGVDGSRSVPYRDGSGESKLHLKLENTSSFQNMQFKVSIIYMPLPDFG